MKQLLSLIQAGWNWLRLLFQAGKTISLIQERLNTMSAKLDAYIAAQTDFNTKLGAAFDAQAQELTGITEDIKTLNDKITELQNSTGDVTPEDAARLDDLQAQGAALQDRATKFADALKALNDLTANPPQPPANP